MLPGEVPAGYYVGLMAKANNITITGVEPEFGAPGGELVVYCRGFMPGIAARVLFGEVSARILSASEDKVVIRLPDSPRSLGLVLQTEKGASGVYSYPLAARVAGDLHPVSNPVVASDGSVYTTISGSRGQEIAQPLIRITPEGEKSACPCQLMNPTGLAFSPDGRLYISCRNDGTVVRTADFEHLEVVAVDLGIPTGLAFDSRGRLYVGDRTGNIYRLNPGGSRELFARLEPSVSAYHLAMDSQDRLYVSGPTLSMNDCIYRVSTADKVETLVRGLARPQGLAFLPDGDLLFSAGFMGKKGVLQYSPADGSVRQRMAAPVMVGLAPADSVLYLAGSDTLFRAPLPGREAVN